MLRYLREKSDMYNKGFLMSVTALSVIDRINFLFDLCKVRAEKLSWKKDYKIFEKVSEAYYEKNTLENMCVYYKDAEGLRFEKQEHIIPAFLGGKKMLDQGVVSDQANELFSGIEKHAAMESFINIDRMFLGPGKRGSRNPKKAGSTKISVMCSQNGRASLGYILMGKPKQIMQCFLESRVSAGREKVKKRLWCYF